MDRMHQISQDLCGHVRKPKDCSAAVKNATVKLRSIVWEKVGVN